ncbi:MAG: hypothetical protein HQL23_06810 [Candidatus Omnitrophica bacterium]|nr:hypothetical protein [Candidatus Omnitrophota bacterium]
MKRVGIIASKIVKDKFYLYNLYVVAISFIFSFFLFIIAGSTVLFSLKILAYISEKILKLGHENVWPVIFSVTMITLAVITFIFNLCLIFMNFKIREPRRGFNRHEPRKTI